MDLINRYANYATIFLVGSVTAIVLYLLYVAARNPVLFKLALRNIPRRPGQSFLIVLGLTLSTVIVVASFATGDTLSYSVQRQAVAAYGKIDEIIAPPLLSLFVSLGAGDNAEAAAAQEEFARLTEGGLTSVLAVLEGGLPGISEERLAQLKADAAQEPQIDAVAGSIIFPTIIRNKSTGQGEPLGFIVAVDDDYDQTFGLNTVEGDPVEMEALSPGVGNIFLQANNLFVMANTFARDLGLDLNISDVAQGVAALGAVLTSAQGGDLANATIDLSVLEQLGVDTAPLREAGIETLNLGELAAAVPGLAETLGITGTSALTDSAALSSTLAGLEGLLGPLSGEAPTQPVTATQAAVTAQAVTATATVTAAASITAAQAITLPSVAVSSAVTATQPLTAARTVTGETSAQGGLLAGVTESLSSVVAQAGDLFSSFNLNTMGDEIDRVLAQFGLQLRQGDLYLNRLGAERLDARAGDVLEIFIGPIPVPFRVRAVVEEAGPVGALLPVVMLRLDEAQKLLFMNGKVNNVLVSNTGDELGGMALTDPVSDRLRVLALDDAALEQAAAVLRRPDVLPLIEDASDSIAQDMIGEEAPAFFVALMEEFGAFGSLEKNVPALIAGLQADGLNGDLRQGLSTTDVRSWLLELPGLPRDARDELSSALATLNNFDVIDPLNKRTVLAAANVGGSIFTSLFSVFGFFSVVAGILLIFLIFVMLAAERRSEMGIARAVGVQRRNLVQMFTTEGMVYSLAAAALGVGIGLLVSWLMIEFIGGMFAGLASQFNFQTTGFEFVFRASPRSVIISYCLGLLLTFIVVVYSSWRVSRLNIVAAIRDLPDESNARRRGWAGRVWRWLMPLLLLALGAYILYYGNRWELWSVVLAGLTIGLFGIMILVGRILDLTPLRTETVQRIVYTVIGLALLALWVTPWQEQLPRLGLERFAGDPTQILTVFAIGGPMIITGAIMVIMFNAQVLTWLVSALLGGVGSLTPVLKTAIAYPLNTRFRTGMAMVLFAMIMATVVVMAVVIAATQSLIVLDEKESGGFDVSTSNTLLSFFDPVYDLQAEMEPLKESYPLLNQIEYAGGVAERRVEVETASDGTFGRGVAGVTPGYIDQARTVYGFQLRAPGFADDAAVWDTLRTRDDVIIVGPGMLDEPQRDGPLQPGRQQGEAGMGDPDDFDGPGWRSIGVPADATELPELFVTLSSVAADGERIARRVQVIGVLEDAETRAGGEVQANLALLSYLAGERIAPGTYYIKTAPGADPRLVAQEVERAFLSSGLDVSVLSDVFAQGQAVLRSILRLLQGFMAIGLLVGIAGLGVIATRTVVERRQQVGMLRAIGYQSRMVTLSFVLEASFIAITGLLIGTATGIVLGMSIVRTAFQDITTFSLPWGPIALIMIVAYGFALLTTILPAWQAGRIYPAEALRYE